MSSSHVAYLFPAPLRPTRRIPAMTGVPQALPSPARTKLAIVAPTFNAISETFIADHVRTLAPGRTALVCQDSLGAERYGCPVLSHVQPAYVGYGAVDGALLTLLARLRRRFGPALNFADRMRLTAFLQRQGVGRVLAEFGHSGVQVADVCNRLDIPLYVYFRGVDASAALEFGTNLRRYRRMFGQVRAIFCVSRHIADRIVAIGCPPELIHINPSGVLIDSFLPGAPEPGRIVAVGRLVEKKAPHLTLEAFALAAARNPQAHLDMVGEGPLAGRCREAIERLGLQGRVTMHGALDNAAVARLMSRASVFVQHSVRAPNGDIEGFPTAIAEAMSSGLAIVSTRHSGIPEHVQDGKTGLIVEEGDVAGMGAALARMIEDPDLARRLGAAARAHAVEHLDRRRARQRVRDVMGLPEPLEAAAGAPNAAAQGYPILQPQKAV